MLQFATVDNLTATASGALPSSNCLQSFSPADFRSPHSSLQCGMVKSRHYVPPLLGQQEPNWYFDVSQPPIAARPVVGAGTTNSVPAMITKNVPNLTGRDFGCYQPVWCPNCL